jgi:thymidylate kinase
MSINKFMIEGLDRLGKDTLIGGIQHRRGYHQVLHFSKPVQLECYTPAEDGDPIESKREALFRYQEASFRTMFSLMRDAVYSHIICNRAHLGECVYAPLYRGYDGEYVFELERSFMKNVQNARLILLTEDFEIAKHFVDDGLSLGTVQNREREQQLFLDAFEASTIRDKRIICVTDPGLGGFKPREWILEEALA